MGRRTKDRTHRWTLDHEPQPEGPEWVEFGDQLIWPVGFTEGGAPYGLTLNDFRTMNDGDAGSAGWARAKLVLRELLEASSAPSTRAHVDFVSMIGQGLLRDIFAADVQLAPDPDHRSGAYAVLLPRPHAERGADERVRTELRLLARLLELDPPFRVPAPAGAWPDSGRLALVREFVPGIELDLRAGRQPGVHPWEILGRTMAGIHAIDRERVADIVPGYTTRREHAQAALRVFEGLDQAELCDARAWAEAHLPPAEPDVLVHGDLLGQNILLDPGGPPWVIDWEFARRGDPAYDLAIVTRGVKRPFQVERGLEMLVESYQRHGSAGVACQHVRLHELCLLAGWFRESFAADAAHPPEEELRRLRGLLRRTENRGPTFA